MRAQILTGRSRQVGGDDAQQVAGVTEDPLGPEHVPGWPRLLLIIQSRIHDWRAAHADPPRARRRWIGSDSVRMTIPYCDSPLVGVVEQLLDAGAASKGLDELPVVDLSEGSLPGSYDYDQLTSSGWRTAMPSQLHRM
jgi:hypothetical protein